MPSPINFERSLEQSLVLPNTKNAVPFLCSTTADSVSCIDVEPEVFASIPGEYTTRLIYSSFPNPTTVVFLPHVLAEFKAPGILVDASNRQVLLGMVSALYQRRALGFPRQFVFGISHERGHTVNVFAARWENTGADNQINCSLDTGGLADSPTEPSQQPANEDTQETYFSEHVNQYSHLSNGALDMQVPAWRIRSSTTVSSS